MSFINAQIDAQLALLDGLLKREDERHNAELASIAARQQALQTAKKIITPAIEEAVEALSAVGFDLSR